MGRKPSLWFVLMSIILLLAFGSVLKILPEKINKKLDGVGAYIVILLTYVVLRLIYSITGIDLIATSRLNANYGTSTYLVFIIIIPLIIAAIIKVYLKRFLPGFPDSGTWYCDELQLELCFDESGDSFVTKDQRTVPCRLEIRNESKLIYLISKDLFEECIFSGKFISRTTKQIQIEDRNSHCVYKFVPIYQ